MRSLRIDYDESDNHALVTPIEDDGFGHTVHDRDAAFLVQFDRLPEDIQKALNPTR